MLYIETGILVADELIAVHHIEHILVVVIIFITRVYFQQRVRECTKILPCKYTDIYFTEWWNFYRSRNTSFYFLVVITSIPKILKATAVSDITYRIFTAQAYPVVPAVYK